MNGTSDVGKTGTYEDEGGLDPRQRRAEGAALAVALVAVYVIMEALASAGASDVVVYGVYVATATMLVLGTFGAARSAIREDCRHSYHAGGGGCSPSCNSRRRAAA